MGPSSEEVTEIELYPNAVAPRFWPYLRSRARFLLLWGGRDSSKSDFVAAQRLGKVATRHTGHSPCRNNGKRPERKMKSVLRMVNGK